MLLARSDIIFVWDCGWHSAQPHKYELSIQVKNPSLFAKVAFIASEYSLDVPYVRLSVGLS